MISIGAVYQGPELEGSSFYNAIMALYRVLDELGVKRREGVPWVNVVFVVPGSLGDVDLEGLEFGKYSHLRKGVVVQVPVPQGLVYGGDVVRFIVESLHKSIEMASEFFSEKGLVFPGPEAESIVGDIAEPLRSKLSGLH